MTRPPCRACQRAGLTHRGRGLCHTCHRLHTASGTLHWFPAPPRGRAAEAAERLADYAELRSQGEQVPVAAARAGVCERTGWRYQARLRQEAAA